MGTGFMSTTDYASRSSNFMFDILLNTDMNMATGDLGGADYWITITQGQYAGKYTGILKKNIPQDGHDYYDTVETITVQSLDESTLSDNPLIYSYSGFSFTLDMADLAYGDEDPEDGNMYITSWVAPQEQSPTDYAPEMNSDWATTEIIRTNNADPIGSTSATLNATLLQPVVGTPESVTFKYWADGDDPDVIYLFPLNGNCRSEMIPLIGPMLAIR